MLEGADGKSVWIRETKGCVEFRLKIADREDREFDAIRKDGGGGGGRLRMFSVEAEFLCPKANVLSFIVYA